MDIEGKIILDLGIQSGTSKAGNFWKKRELVLETFGQYPRKVKFHVFGDRVDTIPFEIGNNYILSFDLESREFNGRWYTDVSVYKAQAMDGNPGMGMGNGTQQQPGAQRQYVGQTPASDYSNQSADFLSPGTSFEGGFQSDNGSDEDLPF